MSENGWDTNAWNQLALVEPEPAADQGELALPDAFDALERRAEELRQPPRSTNTRKAWARACASYVEHLERFEQRGAHQGTPDAVVRWIVRLEADGLKPQSIAQLVGSVSGFASSHDLYNPCDHVTVKNALANLRRRHDADVRKRTPLSDEDIKRLVAPCDDSTKGIRDRAMVLALYATGMRRDSLVRLNCGDVELVPEGFRVTYRRSKTNQEGKRVEAQHVDTGNHDETCPVRALRRWLFLLYERHEDDAASPLFRSVNKGGRVQPGRMALRSVNYIVDELADRAKLELRRLGTHSFRRGHAHQLDKAGVPLQDIADSLGHRNIQTTRGYVDERPRFDRGTTKKLGL